MLLADAAADRETIQTGQHPVEYDQLRLLALDQRQCGRAIERLRDGMSLGLKVSAQDIGERDLVLDDQNARHRLSFPNSPNSPANFLTTIIRLSPEPSAV